MRHTHRKDANHDAILTAAARIGWYPQDTSQTGLGYDAILVKGGRVIFAEIKDGSKPISQRELTVHEKLVHATLKRYGVHVEILTCEEDLLMLERGQPQRREG